MELSLKWQKKLIDRDLQAEAYLLAKSIHDSFFPVVYGTSSYFHSFAERLPEFLYDGAGKIKAKLEEESKRGIVLKYWETENMEGDSFLSRIDFLFSRDIPRKLKALARNHGMDMGEQSPLYQTYYQKLSSYVFNFLADFIVLEEKKNGTTQE